MKQHVFTLLFVVLSTIIVAGQPIPDEGENIDYLVTFGKKGLTSWGDDDFLQIFFLTIPTARKEPFYIRVYDADTGGELDEKKTVFDTRTKYSVYGGIGAFSHDEVKKISPPGNTKTGNLLISRTVAVDNTLDKKWMSLGPFSPADGEYIKELNGYVFKILAEGMAGDDGNLYKYFISGSSIDNKPVEGANAFTYKYTFRLSAQSNTIAHLYPFVDNSVTSITVYNFDFDNEGEIMLYSLSKINQKVAISGDNVWANSKHTINDKEKNSTIDVQILKKKFPNNDLSIYITNQYNKPVPFFAIPIGGPPKFKYKINVNTQ